MPETQEEAPPLGSWGRMYVAVIVTEIVTVAAIALFSIWPF